MLSEKTDTNLVCLVGYLRGTDLELGWATAVFFGGPQGATVI